MSLDKDKIKESLTNDDIKLLLNELGSKDPLQGNQYQTCCHGGNKHKLYYYEESKLFHCYTDCGDNFDIFELVIRSHATKGNQITFYQAVQFVAAKTGKSFRTVGTLQQAENHLIDDWNWINKFKKKDKIKAELPVFNEKVLDVFIHKPHEEWLDDGISYETQMKYGVCYYQKDHRIITPHFNINNELVGLTGRALREEDIEAGKKYMPITVENKLYSFPTMFNLYGLNRNKATIQRLKKVAIFESQKSVMKCEDFYGEDNFSVATCSSSISNWHRDTLLSLGVEEVFIAHDKQFREPHSTESYDYAEKLLKLAHKFSPYAKTYILFDDWNLLDYKDSPCDKGKDILETLMKMKYEIKTQNEVIA